MTNELQRLAAPFPPDVISAFLDKVMPEPNSGCWFWMASIDGKGYGKFIPTRRQHLAAHRISHLIWRGPIPAGAVVRHKCDVKICVNPDHLLLGTQADNIRDMHERGRAARGERTNTARLTEAQVRGIRSLAALGRKQNLMAAQYNVSPMTISRIVRRQLWSHI